MPIELHKKAAAVAEERGISLNELVKLGLEKIVN
jgi:predicted HicB family RNase H-like nuclease